MSKICTNCGREVSDESLFCSTCGARFAPAEPVQQAPVTEVPVNQNPYSTPTQNPYETTQPQTPYQSQPQPQYQYQAPYQPVPQPVAAMPKKAKVPGRGFGIASMVLGIIAVVNAFSLLVMDLNSSVIYSVDNTAVQGVAALGLSVALTMMVVFVGLLTLLSLIFGIVSVVKGYRKTSIAGLIMGGISLVICIVTIVVIANIKTPSISEIIANPSYGSDYSNDFGDYNFDDIDDFSDFYSYFDVN